MKKTYVIPLSEEVTIAAETMLAESPGGRIEDMPGDVIYF